MLFFKIAGAIYCFLAAFAATTILIPVWSYLQEEQREQEQLVSEIGMITGKERFVREKGTLNICGYGILLSRSIARYKVSVATSNGMKTFWSQPYASFRRTYRIGDVIQVRILPGHSSSESDMPDDLCLCPRWSFHKIPGDKIIHVLFFCILCYAILALTGLFAIIF